MTKRETSTSKESRGYRQLFFFLPPISNVRSTLFACELMYNRNKHLTNNNRLISAEVLQHILSRNSNIASFFFFQILELKRTRNNYPERLAQGMLKYASGRRVH